MRWGEHVGGIAAGGRVSIESDAARWDWSAGGRDRNILPAIDRIRKAQGLRGKACRRGGMDRYLRARDDADRKIR
jgi:hypothetical protein